MGSGGRRWLPGFWPDKHLVSDNTLAGNDLASYDDFLTRLARAGRMTFAGLGWGPLGRIFLDCGQPRVVRDADVEGFAAADLQVVGAASRQLRDTSLDAAFVYLGAADECAHNVGTGPVYAETLRQLDAQVGTLLDAIAARATYPSESWLVVLVTDHGHVDGGGHGGQSEVERTSWVIASGAGVRPPERTVHIVDIASAVIGHLQVPVEPGWGLDGRSFLG